MKTIDELSLMLDKKRLGRPPAPQGDRLELEEAKKFFRDRHIAIAQIAKGMRASGAAVRVWFKGEITAPRLAQMQELIKKIEAWELENGRTFGN